MFDRLKEPSTIAGIGIASLTALQTTGSWYYMVLALISSIGAIFIPEGKK